MSEYPEQAASVMAEIDEGIELKKCQKCGCMKDALDAAERAFSSAEDSKIQTLATTVREYRSRMQPLAYDCIGCKKCFGADATIKLAENFEGVEADACSTATPEELPVVRVKAPHEVPWPPYPGDYSLGDATGSVAVCTLSSRELPAEIIRLAEPSIGIAGRCDTENIGVEKVVLNILAAPRLRSLILCGTEAQGHRTGDAFRQLKAKGVDANMRVLESASWRPILKNLTLVDVARFREQVQIVDLVGEHDPNVIANAAQNAAAKVSPDLSEFSPESLTFERIRARNPEKLKLDPAGFFIVIPNYETGEIVCEHYENNGRLAHVVEGKKAPQIASTVVERGLITRLDHAAYLGREIAKAEIALQTGSVYEQDAALGILSAKEAADCSSCAPQ